MTPQSTTTKTKLPPYHSSSGVFHPFTYVFTRADVTSTVQCGRQLAHASDLCLAQPTRSSDGLISSLFASCFCGERYLVVLAREVVPNVRSIFLCVGLALINGSWQSSSQLTSHGLRTLWRLYPTTWSIQTKRPGNLCLQCLGNDADKVNILVQCRIPNKKPTYWPGLGFLYISTGRGPPFLIVSSMSGMQTRGVKGVSQFEAEAQPRSFLIFFLGKNQPAFLIDRFLIGPPILQPIASRGCFLHGLPMMRQHSSSRILHHFSESSQRFAAMKARDRKHTQQLLPTRRRQKYGSVAGIVALP